MEKIFPKLLRAIELRSYERAWLAMREEPNFEKHTFRLAERSGDPSWLSVEHAWCAFAPLEDISRRGREIASRLSDRSCDVRVHQAPPLQVVDLRDSLVSELAVAKSIPDDAYRGFGAHVADSIESTHTKICAAESVVREIFPDAFSEMRSIVRQVVLIPPGWMRSMSVSTNLGSIILGARREWNTLEFYDLLLHEASHQSLELKSMSKRFLIDEEYPLYSPLRCADRPANAVLHAAYVTTRLYIAMERWRECCLLGANAARIRGQDYRRRALDAIAILVESSKLTNDGEILCDNLSSVVESKEGDWPGWPF